MTPILGDRSAQEVVRLRIPPEGLAEIGVQMVQPQVNGKRVPKGHGSDVGERHDAKQIRLVATAQREENKDVD